MWCYHHFDSKAALYQLQYHLDVYWDHNASLVCPLETPETSQSSSAHHLLLLGYRRGYPCLQIHPLWKGNVSESQIEHVEKFRTPYQHLHNYVSSPPINSVVFSLQTNVLYIELDYLHFLLIIYNISLHRARPTSSQHSDIIHSCYLAS